MVAVEDEAAHGAARTYTGQTVWRSISPVRRRGLTELTFLLGDSCFFGLCRSATRTYGFGNVTEPRRTSE